MIIFNYINLDERDIDSNQIVFPQKFYEISLMAKEIMEDKVTFDTEVVSNQIITLLREKEMIFNGVIKSDLILSIKESYQLDKELSNYYDFNIDGICETIPKLLFKSYKAEVKTITYLILINYLSNNFEEFNKTIPYKTTDPRKRGYQKKGKDTILRYRKKLKQLIKENDNFSRSDLSKNYKGLYSTLMRDDRKWFESMLPESPKSISYDINEDIKIRNIVEETYNNLLEIGKRICKEDFVKINELRNIINNNLYKFPITREYIESIVETLEQYDRRRIMNCIDSLIERNESITYFKISKLSKVHRDRYKSLKKMVDEYLIDLGYDQISVPETY